MARETFVADLVADFTRGIGLGGVTLNPSGRLDLRIGELPVTLLHRAEPAELLWLTIDLGEVPAQDPEALRFLLGYGFLCWSAGRMTVAMSDDADRAYAFNCVPVAALSAQRLQDALVLMVTTARDLLQRLAGRSFDLGGIQDRATGGPAPGDIRV